MSKTKLAIVKGTNESEYHFKLAALEPATAKIELEKVIDEHLNAYNRAVSQLHDLKDAVHRNEFQLHSV